jgi:hypothetical protein
MDAAPMSEARDPRLPQAGDARRAGFLKMLRSVEAETDRLGEISMADVLVEMDAIIGNGGRDPFAAGEG